VISVTGVKSGSVSAKLTLHERDQFLIERIAGSAEEPLGSQPQMREVVLGDGYGSQNSLRQYFGLSDADEADELVVRWPRSGIVQKFPKVAANRIVQVTEGSDALVEKRYSRK